MLRRKRRAGFTIVELLVVIVVIAILAALVVTAYNTIISRSKESSLISDIGQASKKIELYRTTGGSYPVAYNDAGISLQGTVSYTGAASTFCLSLTRDGFVYSVSSGNLTPRAVACPSVVPSTQLAMLYSNDPVSIDFFGNSVDFSGDTVVVGDNTKNGGDGAAYIFTRSGDTWSQQAKLIPSDAATADNFGYSVGISGDTVVVGSYWDDNTSSNTGSAYIFTRSGTTWTQQAKLLASDRAASDQFGNSVSISGDSVLIGAFADNSPLTDAGSAYVFTRSGSTWTQQAKLVASDAAATDIFGDSVSLSGDTAAVGAIYDDDNGSESGSAYIFTRSGSTWTQRTKLIASDATTTDYFGSSIFLSGGDVIVGAESDDDLGTSSGSAYIFTGSGSTWTQQGKLLASDGAASNYFGGSVALSGNTAIVGAYQNSPSGAAYVYTRSGSTWSQHAKLVGSTATPGARLGISVSINGNTAAVGATGQGASYSYMGALFIFQ